MRNEKKGDDSNEIIGNRMDKREYIKRDKTNDIKSRANPYMNRRLIPIQ